MGGGVEGWSQGRKEEAAQGGGYLLTGRDFNISVLAGAIDSMPS